MIQAKGRLLAAFALTGAAAFAAGSARVEGREIRVEFDGSMHSRLVAVGRGEERAIGDFGPSEFIRISGGGRPGFRAPKPEA